MQYRYHVGHSESAIPEHEHDFHRWSSEQLRREYEQVHFPFRYCFNERDGHSNASYLPRSHGDGVEIRFAMDESQSAADELVAKFLNCWNEMVPGLAVVVLDAMPPDSPPVQATTTQAADGLGT